MATESVAERTWTDGLCADTATLTLSLDSLARLPDGAVYALDGSRTRLTVGRGATAGTVTVRAVSDSVVTKVWSTRSTQSTQTYRSTQSSQSSQAVRTSGEGPSGWPLWLLVACAAVVVVTDKLRNRKE